MKILGSDYDGTFARGGIGKEKLAAVARWRALGNKFGIVTGRDVDFRNVLRELAPELEMDFFIGCNGACITDETGGLIFERKCTEVPLEQIVYDLLAWGGKHVNVTTQRYNCAVESEAKLAAYADVSGVCLASDLARYGFFYQVSVVFDDGRCIPSVIERIRQNYGEVLDPIRNETCIDVVPKGINKGEALEFTARHFNCPTENVVAVGDGFNDIEMLRRFDSSYAMANGVSEAKRIAHCSVMDVTEVIFAEIKK